MTSTTLASIPSLVANLFSQTSPFVQFDRWHIGEYHFEFGPVVKEMKSTTPASIPSLVANLFSQTSPFVQFDRLGTFMCNYAVVKMTSTPASIPSLVLF